MSARGSPGRSAGVVLGTTALLTTVVAALASCTTMSEYSVVPHEYSGVRLYQTFCSSCHGLTGRGDGPLQPLLRGGAPDLTRISERRGGKFPESEIREIVDGRKALNAHGTSQMPVWGFEFYSGAGTERSARAQADKTVNRLVDYLKTLQAGYSDP